MSDCPACGQPEGRPCPIVPCERVAAPALSLKEAQDRVATRCTAPKVTETSIAAKIDNVEFIHRGVLTICIITMRNGFMSVGKSAPASPANFDPLVGERYAYDDAFKPLWVHEGYLLREKLSEQGR